MPTQVPLKILRIITRLNVGGPAIQTVFLSREFPLDRYQTLLVCGNVGYYEGDMAYLARKKGVEPLVIPELGREVSIADDFKAFLALREIIKRFRPHIIHTHTAKAGALGRLAAFSINIALRPKNRIKVVHTFHGHVFHSYFGVLKTFFLINIERLLARFTDRIIVISALQKKDICGRFRIADEGKTKIISLGFDLSNFTECETGRRSAREKYLSHESTEIFLVGIIGRLTDVKNHRLLLEALKCLKSQGKIGLFRFLIVGDGELKAKLKNEALDLGVLDELIFAGWQSDMPSVYGALDAVALTSKNEGTPVTVIEAMAAQKPVVATDVGGVRDLLGETVEVTPQGFELARNGILIPPGDGEALANALVFLLGNREKTGQMSKSSKEFVLGRYSLERLLNDLDALYSELKSR